MNTMIEIEKQKVQINETALQNLVGKMVGDLGAVVSGALVVLGDRLGLYRALAETGPADSAKLAARTRLDERYVREWLANQAASGYVNYEPKSGCFSMSAEQKAVFADPESPVAMTGGFYAASSVYHDEPKVAEAFRTGAGIAWQDHHNCLFCGVEKFFRPGYAANLVQNWIPALGGVQAKLEAGARVADIGCGHGASTIIMAKAFPKSISIPVRSNGRASAHARPGSRMSRSRPPRPRSFRDAMTSLRPLTRCMTWAIQWERPRTRAKAWRRTAPG